MTDVPCVTGLVEREGGGAEEAVGRELALQGVPQIHQDPRHRQDDFRRLITYISVKPGFKRLTQCSTVKSPYCVVLDQILPQL